jgi:hypothetical protein
MNNMNMDFRKQKTTCFFGPSTQDLATSVGIQQLEELSQLLRPQNPGLKKKVHGGYENPSKTGFIGETNQI